MRYVNLKKKHTSKSLSIFKRLASVSLGCLALTAAIVIPLTSKESDAMANHQNPIIDIDNEYLIDEGIEAVHQTTFEE